MSKKRHFLRHHSGNPGLREFRPGSPKGAGTRKTGAPKSREFSRFSRSRLRIFSARALPGEILPRDCRFPRRWGLGRAAPEGVLVETGPPPEGAPFWRAPPLAEIRETLASPEGGPSDSGDHAGQTRGEHGDTPSTDPQRPTTPPFGLGVCFVAGWGPPAHRGSPPRGASLPRSCCLVTTHSVWLGPALGCAASEKPLPCTVPNSSGIASSQTRACVSPLSQGGHHHSGGWLCVGAESFWDSSLSPPHPSSSTPTSWFLHHSTTALTIVLVVAATPWTLCVSAAGGKSKPPPLGSGPKPTPKGQSLRSRPGIPHPGPPLFPPRIGVGAPGLCLSQCAAHTHSPVVVAS